MEDIKNSTKSSSDSTEANSVSDSTNVYDETKYNNLNQLNQPIMLLNGIIKNIADSFGFVNNTNSNNKLDTNASTQSPTKLSDDNEQFISASNVVSGLDEESSSDNNEFEYDSFDESSSEPLENQAKILEPPPTVAPRSVLNVYSKSNNNSNTSTSKNSSTNSLVPDKENSQSTRSVDSVPPVLPSGEQKLAATSQSQKLTKLKRLTLVKKEPIHAEYGYLGKIAKNEEVDQGKGVNWERSYLVLFNDFTIGVCSNQNVSLNFKFNFYVISK